MPADHDDVADARLEEATHNVKQAREAVEGMADLLGSPDPNSGGRLSEGTAERLAAEFLGAVRNHNDNLASAQYHRERADSGSGEAGEVQG